MNGTKLLLALALGVSGCGESAGGACDHGSDAVIIFDSPLTGDGVYEISVTLRSGVTGKCTVKLEDGSRKEGSCSEDAWTILAPSKTTAADDDGLASGGRADILGISLGLAEATGGTILVKLDGTQLGDESLSFDDEELGEGCEPRPRADVTLGGDAGGGGAGGSN